MVREPTSPRQPLLWAAIVFSLGLWIGVRAWRPTAWWMIAILAFALTAMWFLSRRAWLAKGLALGAWFFFGALLIQIHGRPAGDPRLLALSDGRPVVLTARVLREGYARATGPRSVRQSIDVETEEIESDGKAYSIDAGIRLSVYERADNSPSAAVPETDEASGQRSNEDQSKSGGRSGTEVSSASPLLRQLFPMAPGSLFAASCTRRAISAIPELLTMKDTCARTGSACWVRRKLKTLNAFRDFPAIASRFGVPVFIRASSGKFTSSGPRSRQR